MPEKKEQAISYKGHQLVRCGNTIYYGDMAEEFVVMLQVLSTSKVNDMAVAGKIQVQLMATDPDLPMNERILKKSDKVGLYNAMDIAAIWLERAFADKQA